MIHYQRHLGDYSKDTSHLSQSEHGAYNLLMDWYYANERPIPVDKVYRIAKANTPAEKKATDIVLSDFFTENEGFWTQKRIDLEIEKVRGKSKNARKSAEHRWKKSKAEKERSQCGRIDSAMLTSNPITSNQVTNNTNTQPSGCMNAFQEFYDSYPRKIDRVRAGKAFAGINPDPDLLGMMIRHCTTAYLDTEVRYIPSPTTYLNDRRWEDQVGVSGFVGRHTDRSWRDGFVEKHQDRSWADGIDGHVANAEAEIERDHSVVATVVAGESKNAVNAKQGAL